ncbi:MAG: helix-turn-helix transcriptional regulator [Cyanobacteriota bacterium]
MKRNELLLIQQPDIGKLIRELRQLMGLTQEQFAAELGVVYPTVNRWENGHCTPSPMAMKLIAQKFKKKGDRGRELLSKYSSKKIDL